jgi:hypothetical protein
MNTSVCVNSARSAQVENERNKRSAHDVDIHDERWFNGWSEGPVSTSEVMAEVRARPSAAQEYHTIHGCYFEDWQTYGDA